MFEASFVVVVTFCVGLGDVTFCVAFLIFGVVLDGSLAEVFRFVVLVPFLVARPSSKVDIATWGVVDSCVSIFDSVMLVFVSLNAFDTLGVRDEGNAGKK